MRVFTGHIKWLYLSFTNTTFREYTWGKIQYIKWLPKFHKRRHLEYTHESSYWTYKVTLPETAVWLQASAARQCLARDLVGLVFFHIRTFSSRAVLIVFATTSGCLRTASLMKRIGRERDLASVYRRRVTGST